MYISVRPTQPFGPRPPLGGKKIFQKEQPVMVKKPSLSIHIELYIIYPFPNNKYWRTFFSFFHLRKVILPDFSLLGFKRKRIWIWKRKNFLGRRKKSLLIRPWFEYFCRNIFEYWVLKITWNTWIKEFYFPFLTWRYILTTLLITMIISCWSVNPLNTGHLCKAELSMLFWKIFHLCITNYSKIFEYSNILNYLNIIRIYFTARIIFAIRFGQFG